MPSLIQPRAGRNLPSKYPMRYAEIVQESTADWGDVWVHYSRTPYLKINPQPFHQDPAGIYLFPASFTPATSMWTGMPYKFLVRLKPDIRILDLGTLGVQQVIDLADRIGLGDGLRSDIDQYRDFAHFDAENPRDLLRALWHHVRQLHGYRRWASLNKSFRNIGYDAIFDDIQVIHSSEVQLLVLDPRAIADIRLEMNKLKVFPKVMKVFKDLEQVAGQFGEVETDPPKKRQNRYSGGAEISGRINIKKSDDNYASLSVSFDPKASEKTINVALNYSQPRLNYGSGAHFNVAQDKYDHQGLQSVERDLATVFA